jgi:hypothetical protein
MIAELEEEAPKHGQTMIAVKFFKSGHAIFVEATDPDRQQHLDEAVASGGLPLGLIAIDHTYNGTSITRSVFREYSGHRAELVLQELRDLCSRITGL